MWVLSWINWGFLGVMPWWSWVVLAAVAAVASLLLIPSPKLGGAVAVTVAVLLSSIGVKSWGYQQGVQFERTYWEKERDAEVERLTKELTEARELDQVRRQMAERDAAKYLKERDDAIAAAEADPNAGAIAIPEHLARRLWDAHQRRRQGGAPPDANGNPAPLRFLPFRGIRDTGTKGRVDPGTGR